MRSQGQFRVGLVGAGYVSEFHIRALRRLPNVHIVGISDLDPVRAQAAVERLRLPASFSSLQALASQGLDVVHILTPPASHAELALEALRMGCHVLVEKPLATSVEDCDRIAAAAKAAGKTVCVNHSLCYDYFVVRARKLIQSGVIGELLSMHYFRTAEYLPYRGGPLPPQYREGGYPFRDLGVHALYLMEAFLGEIRDVQCQFSNRGSNPNLLYDEWLASVRCARGNGFFYLSWNGLPLRSVIVAQGTRGILQADLFCLTISVRKARPFPKPIERVFNTVSEMLQISSQVPMNVFRFGRKKILTFHGLQMLIAEYYKALAEGTEVPVPPEQARPIVEWTEHVARKADAAKQRYLAKFSKVPTAPILVTGASGFIGRYLVQRLVADRKRVRVFVRREPPADWVDSPQLDVIRGDLGDPEAVERAVAGTELVFHLGAAMRGTMHDHYRGSVVGTRNVVESALRNCVSRLVYVSSLSVLKAPVGNKQARIAEDCPLEPRPEKRGYYSQAKLEAENIVANAVREKDLRAIILRPGRVFGPGTLLLTPDVGRRLKNRIVILGGGRLRLPLIYIEDLVDGLLLAAQSETFDGSVIHLIDSSAVTQNELAGEYVRIAAPWLKIVHLPRPLVYGVAASAELLAKMLHRPAPLSVYRVRSALTPVSFDCTAAHMQLHWTPRIGLREGLARTLAAMTQEVEMFSFTSGGEGR